jgi:lipid-binding SYLF domain-containing protein
MGNEAGEAGPKQKQKVLKKIPQKVIENAVGLAIFTTMRTGLWISGAGGSGVLVARKEDGSWSPPSGIMLHTAGLGFLVGVDIYDCVLVINNRKALESFTKVRATIGGEISAVAGPVGMGGVLENDGKWKEANRPVFTYLKSRGFYAGVQVDGTIVIERTDENARFYNQTGIGVADILAGKVRYTPPELKMLYETLKAAEGRDDVDTELLNEMDDQPAPGDLDVAPPGEGKIFGVPELDDPDPFGVFALEKEGLEIREAGTRSRPSSWQFEYHPKPSSPIFDKYYRKSMDQPPTGAVNGSPLSSRARWSTDGSSYVTSDAGTQTSNPLTPIQSRDTYGDYDYDRPAEINCKEDDPSVYDEIFDIDRTYSVSSYYTTSRHDSYAGPRRVSTTSDLTSVEKDRKNFFDSAEDVYEVPAKERIAPVDLPKGPPPPLPPRQSSAPPAPAPPTSEFEDINLNGTSSDKQ